MKALPYVNDSSEGRFFDALDRYQFITDNMAGYVDKLQAWRLGLCRDLDAIRPPVENLKQRGAFGKLVTSMHQATSACLTAWADQWDDNGPAEELARQFGDRCVVLVFGKVNAGKSSFCNFLAERFEARGHRAERFHVDQGRPVDMDEFFAEGATETTARIQGAYLGNRLVILDTPGLLSVTKENGDLTRRFTNSADAVIWLTSSTSPGQVQELDDLAAELSAGTLLLPVISKSDVYEEDEEDGKIVNVLINKSKSNRDLQETDVQARTAQKLEAISTCARVADRPVSVSVYMARKGNGNSHTMEEAGLDRLFDKLNDIVSQSVSKKRKRVPQLMIRHLEEKILRSLRGDLGEHFQRMHAMGKNAASRCDERLTHIVQAVQTECEATLSQLLEKHKGRQNVTAVCSELSDALNASLQVEVQRVAKEFLVTIDDSLGRIVADEDLRFEDDTIDVNRKKNAAYKALVGAATAAGGAALAGLTIATGGLAILAGVAGGIVGGMIGTKGAEFIPDSEVIKQSVGVSYSNLQVQLQARLKSSIEIGARGAIDRLKASIKLITDGADQFNAVVATYEAKLIAMKEGLQA
ncbi:MULTISPECIES: GTPase [Rhodanobacteraceae]|uniref:GTPase n=1 Tax=Rhodanobacteraceae TaxID=1775411 RepID=UPI0008916175|nr:MULTISPECIES: GTPase [Rhodanobacteraceae]SDF96777.1 50S ribosome-binding GTPase [Dyella sp. 333MFSha]SKB32915.1 Predicted GTPase or GTP-binding protein [Luteibacter sp. 22Crub2.1]